MPIATPQGTLDFKSVDAVTFVGVSSNTVIDTTTGSFGVGVDGNGPTSNLHVVGNAYISTDLTVVGDIDFSGTFNQNGAPFSSSPWTTTGADLSYTTGNVSLGKELTVTGNVSVSDDLTVTGGVTSTTSLMSNVVTIGTTKTFVVKVGSNGKYEINGVDRPTLHLHQHQTYIFDLSDSSLIAPSVHPFRISETATGDAYDTGITTTGTYGSTEKRTFVVPAGAPTTLYYYCTSHSGMGATASISSTAELMVSGRVESTDLAVTGTGGSTLGSGTTAQRPANPTLGTIRYNSTTGYMEAYTAAEWSVIATPPSITSFDITNVAVAAVITDTITVSGSGFDAITNIQLRGADGKNYDTTTFTFTNSGSIGFKIGTLATGQLANRPFKVVATNGAGLSATSSTTLGLGGVTWLSPAASSINDFLIGVSTSLALSAYDGGGGSAVTYTLQSGSYLSGTFTLSGSTITGTTNAAENTTSSVTIRATDNADSSVFLDRTFTLKAVPDALFAFTSHTFTNGGQTGRLGPTLATLTGHSDYSSAAWTSNTAYFSQVTGKQGFQLWTIPATATYRIIVKGAMGGDGDNLNVSTQKMGGYGAQVQADFAFTEGAKIVIIVGQKGTNYIYDYRAGAGGGGTYVLAGGTNFYPSSTNDIYLIAGGGAGGHAYTGTIPRTASGDGSSNGSSSNGGLAASTTTYYPGGGAGWGGFGAGSSGSYLSGGRNPENGAAGGFSGYDSASDPTHGGFGGGGGSGAHSSGGGGGYGGGQAQYWGTNTVAAASTSYIQASTLARVSGTAVFSGNHTSDNGSVIITKL